MPQSLEPAQWHQAQAWRSYPILSHLPGQDSLHPR